MQSPSSPVASSHKKFLSLYYGLGIGAGGCVLPLVIDTFFPIVLRSTPYNISDYVVWLVNLLIWLSVPIAIFIGGRAVARRTRKAGSGTIVGLLAGIITMADMIISLILQMMNKDSGLFGAGEHLRLTIYVSIPVCLGMVYLGFITGLVGRAEQQGQRTIGTWYASALIIMLTTPSLFLSDPVNAVINPTGFVYSGVFITFLIITSIIGFIIWIMLLVEYGRIQAWGAFTLTIFFSGIMLLVYLISGAKSPQPANYVVVQPAGYPPVAAPQPANSEAITILQQRYARGEIDGESYNQMMATLKNS